MHSATAFLTTFAVVLCTAAVTTVVFQWLKQPVILGYLLAGLLIGPHVTVLPFSADTGTTEILAELGVILLLFAIGLEFSIRRLIRVGASAGITAVIDVSLMALLGLAAARMLGWSGRETIIAAAIVAISSTTIIAKTFEDHGVPRKLRDHVFGVLIVEDLVAIMALTAIASFGPAGGDQAGGLLGTGMRLATLVTIWVVAGLLVIPRLMRFVVRLRRPETTVVTSIGLCFVFALLAQRLGYSVALGAFIAGSLISESGKSHHVMELVRPVRDVFAAVFFVSVGMLIDPSALAEHWVAIVVLVIVVLVGKVVAVSLGSFLAGQGTRRAVRAGMSMAQIGEFSFIIAAVGIASGGVREFLYPVAVAVSALTTLSTPWMVGASDAVASWIDRKLPRPIQTYSALYGTWVEDIRRDPSRRSIGSRLRRLGLWLLVDTASLIAVIIGMSVAGPGIRDRLMGALDVSTTVARVMVWVIAATLATPFLFGVFRVARGAAGVLGDLALPVDRFDRALAPRRALVTTIELTIVLLLGLPLLFITEPFLPRFGGLTVLLVLLFVLGLAAWRSATNLQGHVRAGAEVLIAALSSSLPPEQATEEMRTSGAFTEEMPSPIANRTAERLGTATHLLPGIGAPTTFAVGREHYAAGRTLAEIGLRGHTGATALAITRGDIGIPAPSKSERIEPGDILVLVGTRSALQAARQLLRTGEYDAS
ncbi:MAG: cation:proton antiporter [Gemmatimonadales bacterium]